MTLYRSLTLIVIGLCISMTAAASERKAYKIVDEKGNVTYSQTPPPQAKKVDKIDISPANSGRGGNTVSNDLRQRNSGQSQSEYIEQRNEAMQLAQKRRQDAERQRVDSLKAECMKNRGSDCDNPETLRLIEAQRIPGGRAFR
jgi:hypothetical protein